MFGLFCRLMQSYVFAYQDGSDSPGKARASFWCSHLSFPRCTQTTKMVASVSAILNARKLAILNNGLVILRTRAGAVVGFATGRNDEWEESSAFLLAGKKFARNTDQRNSGDLRRGEKTDSR